MAKADIVRPTKHIRERVGRTGGVPLDQALAKANQVVAELAGSENTELDQFGRLLREALAKAATAPQAARPALFNAAHEIRGQAATFGLPLAGETADALCKFLDKRPQLDAGDLPFITVHAQAIDAVIRQRLTGDGGVIGAELQRLLAKAREKRLGAG